MPSLDVFKDDAFGLVQMTKAINEPEYLPGRIAQLGIFEEEGIMTTSAFIERQGETLTLVPAGARGSPAKADTADKRKALLFPSVHLPQRATINADEVQNVRAFGSESEVETVQNVVNKRLMKMRRKIDATLEYQRMGAIKGEVLDADGTTALLDLYTAFGVSQQTQSMELDVTTTKVRALAITAKRLAEVALGGTMATGWLALCSASFFDDFISHGSVEGAYDRWQQGDFLRSDPRSGFQLGGIQWEEYRGSVGGVDFIADGEAYLLPIGVPDMFVANYAPADYMETVNTIGLPYYAKQELLDFNKGVEIEAQSNPLIFNSRPRGVIKLTTT